MRQITWLAGISRPEISFQICEISTKIKSATIADIKAVNKGARFVTSIPNSIMFPRLDPESSSVKMFADASYNNLPNGSSQGEHIVFLSDKSNNSCVVTWNSRSIKSCKIHISSRITCLFRRLWHSILDLNLAKEANIINVNTKISAYTDKQSLYNTVNTTNLVSNKRLQVEISSIHEIQNVNEIETIWLESKKKLGDVLTKKAATSFTLMETCQQGRLAIDKWHNNVEFFILNKNKKNSSTYYQIFEH